MKTGQAKLPLAAGICAASVRLMLAILTILSGQGMGAASVAPITARCLSGVGASLLAEPELQSRP